MTSKIWELHAATLGGAIRTTPEGEADVAGLVLSEKAYLIAIRDFRPAQLVNLVQRLGVAVAMNHLVTHYAEEPAAAASGGRTLVATRGSMSPTVLRRSDEVPQPALTGFRT